MEKSTDKTNTLLGYSPNNPKPVSVKESEQVEKTSLRSTAEYDLKEIVTPL
jgi:hypothetical protein